VFDVFLALLLARALAISVSRRFLAGMVAAAAAASLWLGLAASGWLGRGADGMPIMGAWILILIGPTAVPAPTPSVPWSHVMAAHPTTSKAVLAALLAVPFVLAWTRASAHSPLSDRASELKKLALVYLMPVLLLVAQVVIVALAETAGRWT
jgi:hypothetical protein